MAGFFSWVVVMVIAIVVLIIKLRRSREIDERLERHSSDALNEIGEVAAKKHREKFGRSPTHTGSWYPGAKK